MQFHNFMAYILNIEYQRYAASSSGEPNALKKTGEKIQNFPVIVQKNGSPWLAGCAYLCSSAQDVFAGSLSIKTIRSYSWQLLSYLQYCEDSGLDPMRFGTTRLEKPSYLYKGYLVKQKNGTASKKLSSSTVTARINAVTRFFAWAIDHGWLEASAEPFRLKSSVATKIDQFGFEKKISVQSTDLSIRKSRTSSTTVEGGLTPVSTKVRDEILAYATMYSSPEFSIMLELGFRTGLRIQTICGLHVEAFSNAVPSDVQGLHYFNVGPKYGIPTKFGVNYKPQIPDDLLLKIKSYINSPRRLDRAAKANDSNKKIILLNRWGKPYNDAGSDLSSSVSQDLNRLRKKTAGKLDLREFYFHCTRATFGTSIVTAGLQAGIRVDHIINRLKDLLGHKNASTTLSYIKFIEAMNVNNTIDDELARQSK
ncbi:tyrosine-type recombinase/integrase [Undibacterium sp. TC4M20W]|uniref:tyrosine-type recombinase/integrase n=1 Tax=Undibacterium sp. TC4M20W TaxID=3413052 RepID=UPI003BF3B4BF